MLYQDLLNGLVLSSMYILMAVGLTLIYGVLKLLHIAHASVFAIGAYASVTWYVRVHQDFFSSILVGTLVAAMAGVIVERLVHRPFMGKPRVITIQAGIGVYIFLSDAFRYVFGPFTFGYPVLAGGNAFTVGEVTLTYFQLELMASAVLILILLWLFLKTRTGLALRATSQDFEMASVMGINARRVILITFFVSSAIAGFAGVMYSMYYNWVNPAVGDLALTEGLAIILLGGMGSVKGSVVAGLILALAESLTKSYLPSVLPPYAIAFAILMFILIVRPWGLFGRDVF